MFINLNVNNNENASSKVRDPSSLLVLFNWGQENFLKPHSHTRQTMTLVLLETDDEAMQRTKNKTLFL